MPETMLHIYMMPKKLLTLPQREWAICEVECTKTGFAKRPRYVKCDLTYTAARLVLDCKKGCKL